MGVLRFYMRANLNFIYYVKHFALHFMYENAIMLNFYSGINSV